MAEYREFQDGELIAGTRYQVQRLIGVGGMGTVYEVEHVELGKRFVLKALLRELSRREDLVIRLRNEWRALGRLEHPNIVTVTDAGTSATGVPFYVMERLEGETLSERMRRTRRFPVREAVDIAVGVLEGLAAAHQIGVVHRDVKPPNIFLVGEGRPKVLDFGVAKIADDPGVVTARGIAVGTPRYMSPEQARGESVDGRADVYSTGLILFEMVSGVSPFDDARDANELILAHLVRRPPPLSTLVMGVPSELDVAVAQMLAKSRDERPATARDAARVLRDVAVAMAKSVSPKPRVSTPPRPSARPVAAALDATLVPTGDEHNTTRPDGVASRRSTLTSGSLADGMLQPCPEVNPRAGTSFVPDTLFAPPSFAGAAGFHTGDARVHTEMLTVVPEPEAAVTRTTFPRPTPSETPPPVTPLPNFDTALRPTKGKVALVLGLVGLGAASLLVGALLRPAPTAEPPVAARATQGPTPISVPPAPAAPAREVRALVPAAPPLLPAAPKATAQAPARPLVAQAHQAKSAASAPRAAAPAAAAAERAPERSSTEQTSVAPSAPAKNVTKKAESSALPSSGL